MLNKSIIKKKKTNKVLNRSKNNKKTVLNKTLKKTKNKEFRKIKKNIKNAILSKKNGKDKNKIYVENGKVCYPAISDKKIPIEDLFRLLTNKQVYKLIVKYFNGGQKV